MGFRISVRGFVRPSIHTCIKVDILGRGPKIPLNGYESLNVNGSTFYRVFLSDCLLKKRWSAACFYLGKCSKAAICSLDTPILGEEYEGLLFSTILAIFDTLSSHENGIFTNQKNFANLWHVSQIYLGYCWFTLETQRYT